MKKTERSPKPLTPESQAAPQKKAAHSGDNLTLAEIKQLIELVSEKQFGEFELERGNFRLRLQKEPRRVALEPYPQSNPATTSARDTHPINYAPLDPSAPDQNAAPPPVVTAEENLHIITSPIVGTFYRSSSPTSAPFAKLGDLVESGKTLCIIEAMKLMNEIPSDASGAIAKIFVENGQPVEYGQPLFGIKT